MVLIASLPTHRSLDLKSTQICSEKPLRVGHDKKKNGKTIQLTQVDHATRSPIRSRVNVTSRLDVLLGLGI